MLYVVVALIVPVAIVALAAWDDLHNSTLTRNGVPATATVTALDQETDGDGDLYTVLRFRYPVGEWAEPMSGSCRLPRTTHPKAYAVGDEIAVLYRRRRPRSVAVADIPRRSNMPAALVIAGFIVTIVLVATAAS